MLKDGGNNDGIYLDFQKVFDTVPHECLWKKLYGYGIKGKSFKFINMFLTDKRKRVIVNNVKSDWSPVTSDILQGSVPGPVLFVIFINDIPYEVHNYIQMFADDTKLYASVQIRNMAKHCD